MKIRKRKPRPQEWRSVRRFAWLPKRVNLDTLVWLEWYMSLEQFFESTQRWRVQSIHSEDK